MAEELIEAVENHDSETIAAFVYAYTDQPEQSAALEPPTITPFWQSGWQKDAPEEKMAHSQITSLGCLVYMVDMANVYHMPFNALGYTAEDVGILVEAVKEPDQPDFSFHYHEIFRVCMDHFYDPDKGDGWALHYMQDVNESHHAANLIGGITTHGEFEEYVSAKLPQLIDNMESMGEMELYETAYCLSPTDFLHQGAYRENC